MTDNIFKGIPIIEDPYCPPGMVYLFHRDAYHPQEIGPWEFIDKSGDRWAERQGYEATLISYGNLVMKPKEVNMSKFSTFVARVKVVFNAAPLYLVGASTVVTVVTEEVSKQFPGAAGTLVHITGPALGVLAAAIAIVRRVTPVAKADRGLL